MSAQTLLSSGDKWFSYSGVTFGDVSAPATISMILIPNTGLRDSLVQFDPYYVSKNANTTLANQLGLQININDVTVYKDTSYFQGASPQNDVQLFVPRQSKLEVISLNTSANNTQERGVNVIGYYL
jgi:hypothetical protein